MGKKSLSFKVKPFHQTDREIGQNTEKDSLTENW